MTLQDTVVLDATYDKASLAVGDLESRIVQAKSLFEPAWSDHHHGRHFAHQAARYVRCVNKMQQEFRPFVFTAANRIAEVSRESWENNEKIVGLWHQLAQAVTGFSHHPDARKRVSSLIISKNGDLIGFGANRLPTGIKPQGHYFEKGKRKEYILCSERIALMELLGVGPHKTTRKIPKRDRDKHARWQVKRITLDIIAKAAEEGAALRDSFMLVTTSPCHECAPAIAPHRPDGIITSTKAGKHFSRAEGMVLGRSHLEGHGVRFIELRPHGVG